MKIFQMMFMALMGLFLSLPFFSEGQIPFCYRNLENNFFRTELVNEALSLQSIPQSNWILINEELRKRMRDVPRLVAERSGQINPNPFVPFQPQAASALLRSVLFEVFSDTLAVFHITNQNKVDEMYKYIRERQNQLVVACFGEEDEENR